MRQMLPLLLGWLADSPDPDLGVLGLRRVATGQQRTTELATAFRESPEAARRLCVVLGTSGLLGTVLEHNPDLVPALGDDATLGRRSYVELSAAATRALAWRGGTAERQPGLQRLKSREILRVAARDILGLDGDDANAVTATGSDLAAIAEVTLGAALSTIAPPVPFAVIAVGRFGGGELSYASDLDVLFVYEGSTPSEFADAERAAESLVRFLKGATPAARIYDIDLDLRPEGKDGPLARSLDGYRTYYERWAETWERQALVRARPVAGDADLGRRFLDTLDPFVWRGVSPDEVRDIRRMKARIERERIPAGDDASFHLKLGPGSLSDVEFTTQLLQLESRTRGTSTLGALTELARAGRLDHDDMATLAQSYRFCERTRNRWYLIKGAPGDSLPRQPEMLSRLARSLDTTPSALREQYRRVTRRARQVVQRLFYGVDA
jgi:glutamate-ammonia-ligase adenylyltransferase